jgi:hypothetical protein
MNVYADHNLLIGYIKNPERRAVVDVHKWGILNIARAGES